jgi:hypothetical protein
MQYRLRTLLILLAVMPPMLAWLYFYPAAFWLIGGLLAFSCWVAAIGGIFGKVAQEVGILAPALLILLALFLPPVVMCSPRPAPTAKTWITVSHFTSAIHTYRHSVGQLPPDLESLLKRPRHLPNGSNWVGPYLDYEVLPVDSWGSKYEYQVLDRTNGVFRVWSKGPDRRSHTDDDISF